jgi:prevent-host-death family protein
MQIVNIHEAKTQFSKLIEAALHGEEIVIAKAGKPTVRLVPIRTEKPARAPGSLKGKVRISDDFDAPLPTDILATFESR